MYFGCIDLLKILEFFFWVRWMIVLLRVVLLIDNIFLRNEWIEVGLLFSINCKKKLNFYILWVYGGWDCRYLVDKVCSIEMV